MAEKILIIHCAENGKKALHRMKQTGEGLPANVRTFELPCTGRINEVLLMKTLEDGCDGILVAACHRDNCRYMDGNLRAEHKVAKIRKILTDADIADRAVDIVFVAPDEGAKLSRRIQEFERELVEQKTAVSQT